LKILHRFAYTRISGQAFRFSPRAWRDISLPKTDGEQEDSAHPEIKMIK
jgi:hypothetical protein